MDSSEENRDDDWRRSEFRRDNNLFRAEKLHKLTSLLYDYDSNYLMDTATRSQKCGTCFTVEEGTF